MILSEPARRWAEIRFYYWITDVYKIRRKTLDVIDMAEAICQFGGLKTSLIKKVINKMINDAYYKPYRREIVLLGRMLGVSATKLANYQGVTRKAIYKFVEENPGYKPIPRCDVDEDSEIYKFMETFEILKGVGI